MQNLPDLLNGAEFHSVSVVRTPANGGSWQANLQVERSNSFRVAHGSTPAEAIAALFEPVPAFELPPCPVPLPSCPVPLPA